MEIFLVIVNWLCWNQHCSRIWEQTVTDKCES